MVHEKSYRFHFQIVLKRLLILLIVIVILSLIIYLNEIKVVITTNKLHAIILNSSNGGQALINKSSEIIAKVISLPNFSKLFNQKLHQNQKCLEYLLENNIIEYYYYLKNDEDHLNFTTRGITSKKHLDNYSYSDPSPVLCFEPTESLNNSMLPKHICPPIITRFLPNMMAQEYDIIRNLIKFFKHVAALTGMEYYLNYGSLLGHVRFNKRPIPWDDDVDFSADFSVIKKFNRIFRRERQLYFGNTITPGILYPDLHVGGLWAKIFDATQKKVSNYSWTFPFIDLFYYRTPREDFYDTERSHLRGFVLTDGVNNAYAYNVSLEMIMPLKSETFLGIEVFIPSQPEKLLKIMKYSMSSCKPLWWHHRFEKAISTGFYIRCSQLQGFYIFKIS